MRCSGRTNVEEYKILENKNCFITGASGGIGRNIAIKMAECRCNLFLASTNLNKLKNLKEELEFLHGRDLRIYYEPGDLNKLEDIEKIITKAREKYNSIDILINCSGIFPVKLLSDSNLEDF